MLIAKVKICGVTNYEDARAATDLGADMVGFNFYSRSPRFIRPQDVAPIVRKLPAFVDLVGVFVNASAATIRQAIEQCQLTWVQLHGDEDPQFCRELASDSIKTMKALRVKEADDVRKAQLYSTDAILLDASRPGRYGGTGQSFDWKLIPQFSRRVFIAGGITPANAAEAVQLGVYGIDVCSGVESAPGKKDHQKMKLLFENIRHLRA